MNAGQPGEARERRLQLGRELRAVRTLAGLSGRDLAPKVGVSQASVSRMERGELVPDLRVVRAWVKATKAPPARRAILEALTEAATAEETEFRLLLSGGLEAAQRMVQVAEAEARTIRNFQMALVPGLLQTAEYARRVLTFADVMHAGGIDAAVAARLDRQQILTQPGRSFLFLMTEAALRWRPGPAEVTHGQLLQVASLATLDTVAVEVIPSDAEMHTIPRCPFLLYEDRESGEPSAAFVEVPHRRLPVAEPADVTIYQDTMAALRQSALRGDEAIAFIRSLAG